jgi:hypothetical protein
MHVRPVVRTIAAAGVAALLVACGLTVVGAGAGNVGEDAGGVRPASCARCAKPPDGWAPIALIAADASCPPGSSRTETGVLLEGVRSTGTTCACTCGAPAKNPCFVDDPHPVIARMGGNGPCDAGSGDFLPSGKCLQPRIWDRRLNGIAGSPPAPQKVTCEVKLEKPPVEHDAELASCAIDTLTGACAAGEICVDVGPCILREGAHECPAGFGTPRLVTPASDVIDERTCEPCTCTSVATMCKNAELSLFTSNDCTSGEIPIALDGNCNALTPVENVASYRYSATPSPAGCEPDVATPPMKGEIRLGKQLTICCSP